MLQSDVIAVIVSASSKTYEVEELPFTAPTRSTDALLSDGTWSRVEELADGDYRLPLGQRVGPSGFIEGNTERSVIYVGMRSDNIQAVRRWKVGKNVSYVHVTSRVDASATLDKSFVGPFSQVEGDSTLTKTYLEYSRVSSSHVTRAIVRRSFLKDSSITRYSVRDSTLRTAHLSGTDADWHKCSVQGSALWDVTIKNSNIRDSRISESQVLDSYAHESRIFTSKLWRAYMTASFANGCEILISTVQPNSSVRDSTLKRSNVNEGSSVVSSILIESTLKDRTECTSSHLDRSSVGGVLNSVRLRGVTGTALYYTHDQDTSVTLTDDSLKFAITNIGSRSDILNVVVTPMKIMLSTGCQAYISVDDFRKRLNDDHKEHSAIYAEYTAALAFIQSRADTWRAARKGMNNA